MAIPAIPNKGTQLREYPLDSAATFVHGAAVLADTDGEVIAAGADPTSILGFAAHDAGADPDPEIVIVAVATAETTFWIEGSSDPAVADIGDEYGLVEDADGVWILDKTEAVNTRVVIEDVDLTRNLYEVRVLQANRQLG